MRISGCPNLSTAFTKLWIDDERFGAHAGNVLVVGTGAILRHRADSTPVGVGRKVELDRGSIHVSYSFSGGAQRGAMKAPEVGADASPWLVHTCAQPEEPSLH